jgi:hypothetical protein
MAGLGVLLAIEADSIGNQVRQPFFLSLFFFFFSLGDSTLDDSRLRIIVQCISERCPEAILKVGPLSRVQMPASRTPLSCSYPKEMASTSAELQFVNCK